MKKIFLLLLFISTIVQSQIVNIPDANLKAKLISIGVDTSLDGEIQITEANFYLNHLDISNANITDLTGIEYFSMAYSLNCSGNNITNIILPNNNIDELNCSNNPNLTSLTLTNLPVLVLLDASFCNINSVVLDNLPQLSDINFDNNNLDVLNISESNLPSLLGLFCRYNDLKELYIKNGIDEYLLIGAGNPNLRFVCCDDSQISNVEMLTPISCAVSSYCSFTPGGDYNTITGLIQYDSDQNGCDALDFLANYTRIDVNLDGVSTNSSVFSNGNGEYNLYTSNTGVFGLVPNIENPNFFNVNPVSADVPIMIIDNSVTTQNFCITANGVHPDLEIVIAPIVPARPGFTAEYKIVYRNKGNQVMSQLYGINFFYNQNLMVYVSSTQTPSSIVSGGMSWDFANLLPFESRSINVVMQINAPTDTNPVNIGDVLQFTSSIMPMTGDEFTNDNLFQFNQTVVGSFDPNDITCMEGDVVNPSYIGEYLHYVVNFENTGTAAAENVVVKVEVNPSDFDINSLRILESSHNATIKITDNILEIIFQTIMLDTGGHGNVLLKVKSKDNLNVGDLVTNNAKIYFDYNFPIQTNDANTTFQVLSNSIPIKDFSISLYPNPTSSLLNIKSENSIKSIELYDVQGRIIQVNKIGSKETSVDVSNYNAGVYFVKITTDFGSCIEKIIKK